MKVEAVNVSFDRPQAAYFSGQTVGGSITVNVSEALIIESVYIVCDGTAKVHFTRRRTGVSQRRNRVQHCRAEENYFHQRIQLTPIGGSLTLTGERSFPFAFTLPKNLPSSFACKYGQVSYTIQVVLDRRSQGKLEYKVPFIVNTIVDLNAIPGAKLPTEASRSKKPVFNSELITAKAWLDHAGYVPGQNIMVCGRVDNPTKSTMKGTKVKLVQYVSCRAEGRNEIQENVMAKLTHGSFNEVNEWDNIPLKLPLPGMVPSGLPFCNIIVVAYRLEFILNPGAMSSNLVAPMSVIIGNIPLRSGPTRLQGEGGPTAQPLHSNVDDANPNYPPPSYESSKSSG